MSLNPDLKRQVSSSIKWQVGVSFIQKIISFGTTVILARILGPENYGLFALAFIIINAFGIFKSLGVESALIQRKEGDIKDAADTAFFIIPLLGIILYGILNIFSPIIARFMNNVELDPVLKALGVIFVLWSLSRVPLSLLEKDMKFMIVSVAELTGTIVFSISAIFFATKNLGVWSLVYAHIFNTFIFVVMVWLYSGWKPRLNFKKQIAIEMLMFGKFIFLGSIIWFLKMNLDNFLVGKLLGIVSVGLYAVAFNIANFISDYFGNKIYRVSFSAFSKLQNNEQKLGNAYLKVLKMTGIISFPVFLGILVLGDNFLNLAYGNKWLQAIPVLKVLAIAGLFNTLISSNEAVLLARGKSKYTFILSFIQVSLFFLLIIPFAKHFNITGVAWVVSFASISVFTVSLKLVMKEFSIGMRQIIEVFKTTIICSLFMFVLIFLFENILFNCFKISSPAILFISLFSLACFVYILLVYKFDNELFREIKGLIFIK